MFEYLEPDEQGRRKFLFLAKVEDVKAWKAWADAHGTDIDEMIKTALDDMIRK